MSEWAILEIEETTDLKVIKKAYVSLIKKYKPHEQPEMFKKIRAAYEHVMQLIEENLSPSVAINTPFDHAIIGLEASQTIPLEEILDSDRFGADDLMELYDNVETRNDIAIWQAALQENSTVLLMDDEIFNVVISYIIKSEYLYHSSLEFKPEIYLMLFDFFKIDEVSFISYYYSRYVAEPLLATLSACRYQQRVDALQSTAFNLGSPEIQINAENYFSTQIYNPSGQLVVNIKTLTAHVNDTKNTYFKVLRNVVFRDLLERQLSPTMQTDELLAAYFYLLFKFKNNKRNFYRVFEQLSYSKEDIKNCLEFTKKAYNHHLRPPFMERMIKAPLRKLFFFWYALLIFAVIRFVLFLLLKYN